MNVDFFSFHYAPEELRKRWSEKISTTIQDGQFIGGPHVDQFEAAWSEFTQSKYSVGVSNGFDALVLALKSLNIEKGDFVALPAHTFIATWNAVISIGAVPIGIDVDADGLLDLNEFQEVIEKFPIRAVIPVHMHGSTVDIRTLSNICNNESKYGKVYIVEDASQAHGAKNTDGSHLGKYSDLVAYSLYPTKNLGALGDAGIITTDDNQRALKLRSLRSYGSKPENKYFHEELGFNNRLDPIQATILTENLQFLTEWNEVRIMLSNRYISALESHIPIMQRARKDSVRHHLCIKSTKRDELRKFLLTNGISTESHYPRVAGKEAMKFLGLEADFRNSEEIAKTTLSLPLSQWHSTKQIDYVVSVLQTWRES